MLDFLKKFDLQLFAEDGGGDGGGAGNDGNAGDSGGAGSGDGGGAGSGDDGGSGGNQGKTYDEAYVKKLRDEAAANRVKARDLEQQVKDLPQNITAKVMKALGLEPDPDKNYEQQLADANKKAQEAETKAKERLIRAEVKLMSAEMKIIDADAALALMSREKIKVNDEGTVEGIKEALETLTKEKPYLVGKGTETSVGSGSNPAGGGGEGNSQKSIGEILGKKQSEQAKKQQDSQKHYFG